MSSHRDDARWSADSSARMRFIGSSAVTRLFARTRTGRSSTRRRRRANPTVSEALARYLRGLRYRNRLISTSSAVRYSAPYWSEVKVDWVALRKPPRASAVVRRGKAGPGRAEPGRSGRSRQGERLRRPHACVINGNKIIGGTPSPRRQGRHGRQVRSARRDPPIGEFTHNAVTELSLTVLGGMWRGSAVHLGLSRS
jgi:hypothetical protein